MKTKNFQKLNLKLNRILKIKTLVILGISIIFIVLFFKNIYSSKTKIALCIICKTENLYVREYIHHYKYLGYNHIFIYDNNDIEGERFEDAIKKEIDEKFVSIINYRGKKTPMMRAYIDCYKKNNKYYNWLSFFDIDEFLELKPKNIKIQEFLDNKRYSYCQNIKFNWLLYSDNDKIHYENKPIQKRFTSALYNSGLNRNIKSTVRGNLTTNYWIGAKNPHSGNNNYNCCSSSGKQISKRSFYNKPYDYKYGYLKHYRTKTIEEYINKMKKGKPDSKIDYSYMVKIFFVTNRKTKQKLDIFKKEFNINFN